MIHLFRTIKWFPHSLKQNIFQLNAVPIKHIVNYSNKLSYFVTKIGYYQFHITRRILHHCIPSDIISPQEVQQNFQLHPQSIFSVSDVLIKKLKGATPEKLRKS